MEHLSSISETFCSVKTMGLDLDTGLVASASVKLNAMVSSVKELKDALALNDFSTTEEHMKHCAFSVRPLMDMIREQVDSLEGLVSDKCWPLPKYSEMLFIK